MRKRYLLDDYGEGAGFWAANWDRNWENRYKGPPVVDYRLVRHLEKYLSRDMCLLEGGCGDCQYVRYFFNKGYKVIGVDYAEETVGKVNSLLPHLDVRVGDISHLAFPNDYFDAYYSGGVIEHFEDGVDKPLSEAHRVLKPGGLLFLTVPYMNLSRHIAANVRGNRHKTDLDGRRCFVQEDVRSFSHDTPPEGYHFHEYVFDSDEVHGLLAARDFEVLQETAFSVVWGLLDIGLYRTLCGLNRTRRSLIDRAWSVPLRLARRVESSQALPFLLLAAVAGEVFGNLRLYVCAARKSRQEVRSA